ncbi:MAG: hypothetical protein A3I03_08460 [Candidatus Rokubacteria bacterium RIFCSPLOWO2_02_FULL_68_19]|nr:MAG: hypothetical protein A3I03_08460 [Candidatus Rokubacteria bacterium RIFCSPLOWO2_02_FULL_68_19]
MMKAASSDARKQCTLAISSGPAIRPRGILAIICSLILSGTPASIAVMVAPGAMQFTVTAYLAYSRARVLVRPITPALEAA